MQKHVAHNAPHESFNGNGMSPAQAPWQQRQQSREEDQQGKCADSFCSGRGYFARLEPACRQQTNSERNKEDGDARVLKQEVTHQCAEQSNPVSGWP